MLTIIFLILMAAIFGRLLVFSIKLAWGFSKVLFTLVFLPLILVFALIGGLIKFAFPVLIVIGIISLITVK